MKRFQLEKFRRITRADQPRRPNDFIFWIHWLRTLTGDTGKAIVLAALAWVATHTLSVPCAGAEGSLNQITGTLRFSNTDPTFVSDLGPPENAGMTLWHVFASGPLGRQSQSGTFPASSPTSTSYQLTLDADATGIPYTVNPVVSLRQGQGYYFRSQVSPPVHEGGGPVTLNFSECVGSLVLNFVDASGLPVAVDRLAVSVVDTTTGVIGATFGPTEVRRPSQRLFVRGGAPLLVTIAVQQGVSHYIDRWTYQTTTNVAVACDGRLSVDIALPTAGALGSIRGNIDVLGETELGVDLAEVYEDLQLPDYTGLSAGGGPFGSFRLATLRSVTPSSGAYVLDHLLPNALDSGSRTYSVFGTTLIRSGRRLQSLLTPRLGAGSNPGIRVEPGASMDVHDLFVIDPGHLSGRIILLGPAEIPGRPSMLRSVFHPGDISPPSDSFVTGVGAVGVDDRVGISPYTGAGGRSYAEFDAAFDSARFPRFSALVGSYEMALGGLNRQPAKWSPNQLNLRIVSPGGVPETEYYSDDVTIYEVNPATYELGAGRDATHDIEYCFSEVVVRFTSRNGAFYNPRLIQGSGGAFTNTDAFGAFANYSVAVGGLGWPRTPATAATDGAVRLLLPQGSYHLFPAVTPVEGALSQAAFASFDVEVGCGARMEMTPCLQVRLDAVPCGPPEKILISGQVRTLCGNLVKLIRYSLDGGAEVEVCNACGSDPFFSVGVAVPAKECAEHTIRVTAFDDQGNRAFTERSFHLDSTAPSIQCPGDLQVPCDNSSGAVVHYPRPIATDNCDGPILAVCEPPSGSRFPIGTTIVRCTAKDSCGNSAECKFLVTVNGGCQPEPCRFIGGTNLVTECVPGGARIYYDPPVLVGDCGKTARIECDIASGAIVPVGSGDIYCRALDENNKVVAETFIHYHVSPGACPSTECTLECPPNQVVECGGAEGTIVNYPTPMLNGDCPPGTHIECDPPSGIRFPVGETIVRCKAIGPDGTLLAECKFTVTVKPGHFSIEKTITIRWDCGVLQGSDEVDGSYKDIPGATSPYTISAGSGIRFYRVRD